MKKIIIIFAAILLLGLVSIAVADLEPATVVVHLVRDSDPGDISTATYYIDTSLKVTGTMYAATSTNGAVQDLTDIEILVNVGNVDQGSNIYTGTVADATSGTFHVTTVIPTNTAPVYVQYKLTHTNGISFIYTLENVKTKEAM